MKTLGIFLASLGLLLATVAACGLGGTDLAPEPLASTSQAITAYGSIPAGLLQRVMVGLKENHSGRWMADSGVAWDARRSRGWRRRARPWLRRWRRRRSARRDWIGRGCCAGRSRWMSSPVPGVEAGAGCWRT